MTATVVTLIASIIALVGSLLSLFVGSRLVLQRERRQLLWTREIDRFIKLEELAGTLVEEFGSYKALPEDRTEISLQFDALQRAGGQFARYPAVRQAIRDLHNVLGRLFAAKRDHDDDREVRAELEPTFRALIEACDGAIKRGAM